MSSDKPWDRPWSMDEIISNSDDWSLAGDVALLNTLKAFADSIISRTNDINSNLQGLTNNLDETSLRLNIAQNEFRSLRNTQFIESRVYEDDESLPEEETKPKAEEKSDHTEDIRAAALKGLEMLDEYFDEVQVSVSDSEDEDINLPNFVLRPKDLYLHRPLPYVIGSEEWHKNLHVGLEDSSSDSETEKVSDKFSESDSESDLPIIRDRSQIKGTSDTSSEFDFPQKADAKPKDFLNSSDSESSVPAAAAANPNFAEQLAAKLGTVIQDYEPEVNTRPIQPPRTNYGDIFFDEPPPLDEPKGLFSGGTGLFDDEPKASTARGLFDGGDSDEDIFGKPPLHTEEPPALEDKKRPTGGVSIFGGGNVFDKKLLRRRRSSSEDEEAKIEGEEEEKKIDLFGDDLFKNEETIPKINPGADKTKKTVNLFDSDEEDTKSLFVEKKAEPKEEKITFERETTKVEEKKISLFDDDDLFKDDLFSTKTKKSFTSGLFDDIPDDDLFEKPSLFDDNNSINRRLSLDRDDVAEVSDRKLFESPPPRDFLSPAPRAAPRDSVKKLFDSPPKSDFVSSTPHATPAPNMRLFDPSPPPDDDWDPKSDNLENLSENEDLDFPEVKGHWTSLLSEEPPSLDFKPSPKKPGKLKHNLNINVGALVPGSTPPKRSERSTPVTSPDDVITTAPPPVTVTSPSHGDVSVDEADRVEVLQSVTKDRARVPLKRRPSTRRGRQAALRNSMTDFKLDQDGEKGDEDGREVLKSEENQEGSKVLKIEERRKDDIKLFDESSESEDLFTSLEKVTKKPPQESERSALKSEENEAGDGKISKIEERRKDDVKLFDESSESEDLFRSLERVPEVEKVPKKEDFFSIPEPQSDLFGSFPKSGKDSLFSSKQSDLFGEKDAKSATENDDLFGSPEPDLFGKAPKIPKSDDLFGPGKVPKSDTSKKIPKLEAKIEERKIEAPSKSSLFDDDDDGDLFTIKKPTQSKKQKKALFDDDDAEDDIFSSASAKRTETKIATEKKIPKMSSVKKLENTKPDEDPLSALLK